MKVIKQKYIIKVPVKKVWKAFISPSEIEKWGGGPARMSDKEGSEFSLWDGDIHGTNTKVVENKILDQDWYGGNWDKPSKVKFEFSSDDKKTTVILTHTDLPEGEEDNFADGWKDYYMGPMKEYLERS